MLLLKSQNIAKATPKKFSLTLLATLSHNLVILIIKWNKYCKIFCKPQFWESSTMGWIFCNTPGTVWPQILQYSTLGTVWPQILQYPLSPDSSQPSSCSGHLQFQYSTSQTLSTRFWWGWFWNVVAAFNQSFNCCDLSQTELQLEPVSWNFL